MRKNKETEGRFSMKKKIVLLLSIIMLLTAMGSMMAGCSDKDENNPSATQAVTKETKTAEDTSTQSEPEQEQMEAIPCRYVVPGSEQDDTGMVVEKINEKLKADGVNIDFELNYIGWDVWDQKTNLMLSTGEEFELLHIMEGRISSGNYAGRGALTPIDDILDEYGPVLRDKIDEEIWKVIKFNGKIYSIPALWISTPNIIGWISYRKDLLDKYGYDVPKDVDEMIDIMIDINTSEPETDYYFYMKTNSNQPCTPFHRTYDSFPFFVQMGENFYFVDQDAKVKSWIETDEFKSDSQYFRKMYTNNLLHPDFLSMTNDQLTANLEEGEWIFYPEWFGVDHEEVIQKKYPEAKLDLFRFNDEKPSLMYDVVYNQNGVPVTAKHPEAGVMFLNWLYTNQQNHDMLIHGIEGVHFNPISTNIMENLTDPESPSYSYGHWMTALVEYYRYDESANEKVVAIETEIPDDYAVSAASGFKFNSEPVAVEYANINTEFRASIVPIMYGYQDYDEHFESALKIMKDAGIDKVIAEYQKQLTEWRASIN